MFGLPGLSVATNRRGCAVSPTTGLTTKRAPAGPREQRRAGRLADHGTGHRRRKRRLVGGLGGRDCQSHARGRNHRPGRYHRRRRAGTGRRFWLYLARIKLWLLARAVERVEAGAGGAAGGGQAVSRYLADPGRRRRRDILVAKLWVVGGIGGIGDVIARLVADLAQRRILRR